HVDGPAHHSAAAGHRGDAGAHLPHSAEGHRRDRHRARRLAGAVRVDARAARRRPRDHRRRRRHSRAQPRRARRAPDAQAHSPDSGLVDRARDRQAGGRPCRRPRTGDGLPRLEPHPRARARRAQRLRADGHHGQLPRRLRHPHRRVPRRVLHEPAVEEGQQPPQRRARLHRRERPLRGRRRHRREAAHHRLPGRLAAVREMKRIPVSGPSITAKERLYVADAVSNAWYENANIWHDRFERAFEEKTGVKHAVALPSCTSALHLSLAALGIGPGDEVIVPDLTWIATAAPVKYVGATPVFADVDPQTWCMSADAFARCITPRTRAVIGVDLYGGFPDWELIRGVANMRRVTVIEDAAEAVGSTYNGHAAGTQGLFGTFSFHGSKTMTTGEGGMLVTSNE